MSNILEKKWVAVIRLQKKVMECEAQVKTLQEELEKFKRQGPPLQS